MPHILSGLHCDSTVAIFTRRFSLRTELHCNKYKVRTFIQCSVTRMCLSTISGINLHEKLQNQLYMTANFEGFKWYLLAVKLRWR